MVKPTLTEFNQLGEIIIQKYERYLPNAFDESLTILQKVNKVIEYLNQMGLLVNDIVKQWNEVMKWVMSDGLNEAVKLRLDEMAKDGTLEEIINEHLFGKLKNNINSRGIVPVLDNENDTWDLAFSRALQEANEKQVPFIIPAGKHNISINLDVRTDVIGIGTLIFGENGKMTVSRNNPLTEINKNILSGLNKGSNRINGLINQKNKTLIIRSTDELIKRSNASDVYTRTDIASVVNNNGDIVPRLNVSMLDPNKTTILLADYDKPLRLENIRIEVNNTIGSEKSYLEIARSNVILQNPSIINVNNNPMKYALVITEATNIMVYNPYISGAMDLGGNGNAALGYGVNIWNSANISFFGGSILDCKHSFTGRHAKSVTINGTQTSQSIDCHWGQDWVLNNVKNTVTETFQNIVSAHVLYCGENLEVNGGEFEGGLTLVAVRSETPELIGKVSINNPKIKLMNGNYFRVYGFTSGSENYDFGRVITNPSHIEIEGVHITAPQNLRIEYVHLGFSRLYQQTLYDLITLKNCFHGKNYAKFLHVYKNSDYYSSGEINIIIENINSNANLYTNDDTTQIENSSLLIQDNTSNKTQTNIDKYGFVIQCLNVKNIFSRMDDTAVKQSSFKNCSFTYMIRRTANLSGAKFSGGKYIFENCEIYNITFNTNLDYYFYENRFIGNIQSWNETYGANSIDSQVGISKGNVAHISSTGNIPTLNDFIDKNKFIINDYYLTVKGDDGILKKIQVDSNNQIKIFDL